MAMKEKPDHHDAELVIKLYDLRREAVMRESRQKLLDGRSGVTGSPDAPGGGDRR